LIPIAKTPIFRRLSGDAKEGDVMRRLWLQVSGRLDRILNSIPNRIPNPILGRRTGPAREFAAAMLLITACLLWRGLTGSPRADAKPPQSPAKKGGPLAAPAGRVGTPDTPAERVMALVNGAEITHAQLASECLSRHGNAVLEAMVNREIITQACGRQGIGVTPQDVDTEIDAMAKRFSVPRDKWISLIEQERGISPRQYAEDIVWPMLALRRLAHAGIEPTAEEVQQAFDNQFGEAIKARIIVARSLKEAEQLRVRALTAPDDFGALARQHSVDVGSASANGWVQPIRRYSGDAGFERVVFALRPDDISPVVQVADQFIVVKCEDRLPPADVKLDDARPRLVEDLRERKSRSASSEVFRGLQDASTVENVMNDAALSAASPGVAARVNGQPIGIPAVQATCIERHGHDVLEILITRRLLGQALARDQRTVTQADIDAEIARAAETMGFRKPDGSPDVAAWFERVTRADKIPMRHYIEDIVQPTVSLKQLVGKVPVTQEDLDKAFEATFGPRAKCRIIVMDSQRRAQEVWQLARQNPTPERIGDLAEQYSVDPTSRTLRGEVPPIQRYGGQPALERQAFSLKAGELSGIVQIADRFMVILCEGYTEASQVKFAEVRSELYDDLHEKKQRIEMSRYFSHLREAATIDNFLAGTSQSPSRPSAGGPAGQPGVPTSAGRAATPPTMPTSGELSTSTQLPRSLEADAGLPRAGSRQTVPSRAGPGQAQPSGVRPASLDAPIR
jgi:parvulin-like peptidyl-prolyl isomerase